MPLKINIILVNLKIGESKIKQINRDDFKERLYIQEDVNLRGSDNKLRSDIQMGKTCK